VISPQIDWKPNERFLVLGASGWFGRTMLSLLPEGAHVLADAGSHGEQLSEREIKTFSPTVVLNFAFLTRERVVEVGAETFRTTNMNLINRFVFALDQPEVRLGLTVSSGAVLADDAEDPELNPYGFLKALEERLALEHVTSERAIVVPRAFSVSGSLVRRPHAYAFSDFIVQARSGSIRISARQPVFRRYVSVTDLLSVALLRANQGWSGVLDSGGELVEMGELAEMVIAETNPEASIFREPLLSDVPEIYASDGVSWDQACQACAYTPLTLTEQIREVARKLPE
jgi:nucleoside-diphosphate-sugar epimerase